MHSDPEQLKQKLLAYDPVRDEQPDASVIEDLREVESNPALKAWFEEERAFDRELTKKLSTIPVPSVLKNQILEAAQPLLNAAPIPIAEHFEGKPESFKSWWLNAGLIGGMVAAVLVAAVYFTFFVNPFAPRATPELQQFVQNLEHIASDLPAGAHNPRGYENFTSFFASQGAPVPNRLAQAFEEEAGYACDFIEVEGKTVGVMCFEIGSDKYHVFTLERSSMPNIQNIPRPIISKTGRHACATWTDTENIYVLATTATEATLLTAL